MLHHLVDTGALVVDETNPLDADTLALAEAAEAFLN